MTRNTASPVRYIRPVPPTGLDWKQGLAVVYLVYWTDEMHVKHSISTPQAVWTAFINWQNKLNELTDELSFAMDFNFEYREDFGAFLKTNLNPKNFNY